MRLTEIGRKLGVVNDQRWEHFARKRDAVTRDALTLRYQPIVALSDGRTYAAASVALPSLRLSALQVAVAMAVTPGTARN